MLNWGPSLDPLVNSLSGRPPVMQISVSLRLKKLRRRESAGPARQWSATSLELHRRTIFLGGYFSGVFEVLIWALEPGSQRASCRNRKSALFLARNLGFCILKSILGLSAPPAGRRSCEKYIKRPAAAPIFLNKQFLHIDFVHAKA